MRRAALAGLMLVLSADIARADPFITPYIVIALVAIGTTAEFAAAAAPFVAFAITTAIGVGLSLAFAPRPPSVPPPENGMIAVRSPVPDAIYGVGIARISGAIMLEEQVAGYLLYVVALAAQQVSSFIAIYLNDDLVTVPIAGGLMSGAVGGGVDGRYGTGTGAGQVTIDTRAGLPTETAYSQIVGLAPSIWGVNYRGDYIASLSMTCRPVASKLLQIIYPNGAPKPSVVVAFPVVFDPRDAAQNVSSPSTWKPSNNTALQILYFRCHCPFGYLQTYATAILPNIAVWIQAANDCDDLVALKAGGTEPRYRSGGWTTTKQDRSTFFKTLLASCDGWHCPLGDGSSILQVGKYVAPDMTLTDDDIVGFDFALGKSNLDKINVATAVWTCPDTGYTSSETTRVIDSVDIALRPGALKTIQLPLPYVQSNGQACRLLKIEMSRQSERMSGVLTLRFSGINACFKRWLKIQSNSMPFLNGMIIENQKTEILVEQQICTIDFISTGPQVYAYDPAVDEGLPQTVPQRIAKIALPIPQSVNVVPQQTSDASGAASVYLAISWDEPFYNGSPWILSYRVEYRLHDAGTGTPGAWTPATFDEPTITALRVNVATGNVPVGATLDVQVSSIATGSSLSTASTIVTVSTSLATSAPSSPVSLAATGHAGNATLVSGNPNSANYASTQFFRAASGGSFASSVAVGARVFGSPNGTTNYTDTVAAGTYDYFSEALNSSGVASAPRGPASATVT